MAGTQTSQDLLSLLMGGASFGSPAAVTQTTRTDTHPPEHSQLPQPQQAVNQQQDLLAALFSSARQERESSASPSSLPPSNDATSLLSSISSPFAPSKIQLDGPGKTISPSSLRNDAGMQLLGLLTGRSAEKAQQEGPSTTVSVEEPTSSTSPDPSEVVDQRAEQPSSTLQTEAPAEQARKPSPFTFISPFDSLTAMTSKSRAASSPSALAQETSRPASLTSNPSISHLPPLPKSPSPLASRAISVQDLFAASEPESSNMAGTERAEDSSIPWMEGPSVSEVPPEQDEADSAIAPVPEGLADQAEVQEEEMQPVETEEPVNARDESMQTEEPENARDAVPDGSAQYERANGATLKDVEPQAQNGLSLLPDSKLPQVFSIDVSAKNDDLQTAYTSAKVAISRFSVPLAFGAGRQIAVNGLISYATKAGRVRVIDPQSGARLIKKLHSGLATDMVMSGETVDNGQKVKRLASCSYGKLSVWQIPASFEMDDVPSEVILSISSIKPSFTLVHFSPANPDLLACATKEKKVVLIDLAKLRGTYNGADAVAEALAAQQVFEQSAAISAVSLPQDGSVLTTLTDDDVLSFTAISSGELLGAKVLIPGSKASDAMLLSHSALAIARSEGTIIEIYSLSDLEKPAAVIKLSEGFAHLNYLAERGALAVSTSTGSVYVCTLALPKQSLSTADVVRAALGGRKYQLPTLRHVTEVPASSQIVQSVVNGDSIFYLHPEGFDQMNLNKQMFVEVEETEEEEPEETLETLGDPAEHVQAAMPSQQASTTPNGNHLYYSTPQADAAHVDAQPSASLAAPAVNGHTRTPSQDPTVLLRQMQSLFVEQARMFETMLANQQRAERMRYDQMLGFISETLTANTRNMVNASVQSAVRREMDDRLLPEITKAFNEITRAVEQSQASTHIHSSLAPLLERESEIMSELREIRAMLQPEISYEDLFLRGLQESDPLHLVDEHPLERVFPPNAMPAISPANVLALSLHLTQGFSGGSELGQQGRNRLAWMLACAQAFKYKDAKSAAYIPRVSTGLMSAINMRCRVLTNLEDIEACRAVLGVMDRGGYV